MKTALRFVLVLILCLTLLPLAYAHAEESEIPEGTEIPGYIWVNGQLTEDGHRYGEVVNANFLVNPDDPGDCVTPAVYWKSCINVNPYTGETCAVTAQADWDQAVENLKTEITLRRENGEQADFESIFVNAVADLDAKYKFTAEAKGHSWVEIEYQPSTCEQAGWETYHYCVDCGETNGYVELPPTGHHFVDGVCEICGAEDPNYLLLTVTFDPNYDTSITHKTQDVPKDVETELDKNTYTRSEYLFVGWYEDKECTGTALESITASSDVTLYAKWAGPVKMTGSVSGAGANAYVGETLTATVDNAEEITDFTYQWYWYGKTTAGTGWHAISGATKATYIPTSDDNGKRITCRVANGNSAVRTNYKLVAGEPVTVIDENTFPDEIFRGYVMNFDIDGDGMLSEEEISNVDYINMNNKGASSLKGIEFFTKLDNLNCYGNQLTQLDLSKNTALKQLYCQNNQLSRLDLSENTALEYLNCNGNLLRSLDINNNTALTVLYCNNNFIKSLDVSYNSALKGLNCGRNDFTSLDVSKNIELLSLNCSENKLEILDVRGNNALTTLDCSGNGLTELLVSNNPELETLNCSSNRLTGLDTSRNPELSSLNCGGNQLSELDVSNNPNLKELDCDNTLLSTLDVSNNIALTSLSCGSSQLDELDVSRNTALTFLSCQYNHLTNLNVSNNPNLTTLWCSSNDLTSLRLENTAKLKNLRCSDNRIASLDISGCPVLLQLVENWEPYESYGEIQYGVRPNYGFGMNSTILFYDKGVTLITDPESVLMITFDKNAPDAEGETQPQKVNRGEEAKLSPCSFNYSERIFTGWNTEPDGSGTTYTDGAAITLSENMTLYAQWIEGYTIRFDGNAQNVYGTMNPLRVPKGEKTALPTNGFGYNANYSFTGWNTQPDGSGTSYAPGYSFVPTSDMVLYAQWVREFWIRYYANNGVDDNSLDHLVVEGKTTTIWSIELYISMSFSPMTVPDGKTFNNWNTKPDGSGTPYAAGDTITLTEDLALYAQWKDEEELVTIGEHSFPDVVFRQYVQNNLDTNGNGILSNREIDAVTRLQLSGRAIISLKGIEYFTSLNTLNCEGNYLRTLDVSKNTALTSLNCGWNMLTELDVSNCAKLKTLACASNKLTALNIENCTVLEALTCYDNPLSELNLSNNTALSSLSCARNQLNFLDISSCPMLTTLNCASNNLDSLDLSGNGALMSLYCEGNKLTSLNLGSNSALSALTCGGNQLVELNVSCCPELVSLQCSGTQLTELDVSSNAQLKTLVCNDNYLYSLDVSTCEALTSLDCRNNQLTALDVSNCSALTDLKCCANQLTNLNVEANIFLLGLACEQNQLAELDISNCSGLIMLCESFEPRYNNGVVSYRASASTDFFGGNLRYLSYDEGVEIIIRIEPVPDPDLILPSSLIVIEDEAFAGGAFKYVMLPEGVKTIGWHAFVDCPNLLYIYIPEGIESIDTHAFDGADRLTIIGTPGSEAESYARLHGFAFSAAE